MVKIELTFRQYRADTSWSKTPRATTGSDEKKTLYRDINQSLYSGCPENDVHASYKNRVNPKAIFL